MRSWRGPIAVPQHAHPLVRRLVEEMNYQQLGVLDLAERSGIHKDSLKEWRGRAMPRLDLIDAAFGALGYELAPRKREERE